MSLPQTSTPWRRNAILLIAGVTLFRFIHAWWTRDLLAGDEAYYWEWGRRPDLGYYSKPALIGWIYALVDRLFGGSVVSIRMASALLGASSLLITHLITRKLFSDRAAFLAVVIALVVPGNALLGYLLTIDAPLVLVWSLALLFLWKYSKGESPTWSLLGLFLSIGLGHLSKQMMLFFPPLAVAYLATGPETRPLLKRPATWLVLVGSLVFWGPLLYWNSQHDWITFNHMSSHFGQEVRPSILASVGKALLSSAELLGAQLGAVTPIIFIVIFMVSVVMPLRRKGPLEPRLRFLAIFCGPLLVLVLTGSLFQKIQANWPAVAYLAGIPLAAAWFAREISFFPVREATQRKMWNASVILGILLCGYFYFGGQLLAAAGLGTHKANPNRRLIGGKEMAAAFHEVRKTIPEWQHFFVAATGPRYEASWLAFALPDRPRVYNILRPPRESQYSVWAQPWDDGQQGKNGLILQPGSVRQIESLGACFETFRFVQEIAVPFGRGIMYFSIFEGRNLIKPLP